MKKSKSSQKTSRKNNMSTKEMTDMPQQHTEGQTPVQKRSRIKSFLLITGAAAIACLAYLFQIEYNAAEEQEVGLIKPTVRPAREYPVLSMPEETFVSPQTQEEVAKLYQDITMVQIPRVFIDNLPDDWKIEKVEDKTLFLKIITAQILRANARTLVEKRRIMFLEEKFLNSQPWTPDEEKFFQEMLKKYDVFMPKHRDAQLYELIGKVDIIPPSMAVAQAILITDWGQKNIHAPFGEYGWVNNSYEPLQFKTLTEAMDSFVLQLNSRQQLFSFHEIRRKTLPYKDDMILSEALADKIGLYMDWDEEYTKKLIDTYKLGYIRELDHAQFVDEPNIFQSDENE